MFKLKNESGRSMVEMLGVLAIIGVLSIGGIAGYSAAMKSYRANEIINACSLLYMFGMSQNEGAGANVSYADHFGTDPTGATDLAYTANTKTITMNITDKGVCQQVVTKLGDKVTADCSAASGPYAFTVTMGDVIEPQIYTPEDIEKCGENKIYVSGSSENFDLNCQPCPTAENPVVSGFGYDLDDSVWKPKCHRCPDAYAHPAGNNMCASCYGDAGNSQPPVLEEECNYCSNREWNGSACVLKQ